MQPELVPVPGTGGKSTAPVARKAWETTDSGGNHEVLGDAGSPSPAANKASTRDRIQVALRQWQIRPVWHGKSLPAFFLVVSAAFTSLKDVGSDWAVISAWYSAGHAGWARTGLCINVIGGGLAGDELFGHLRHASESGHCLRRRGLAGLVLRAAVVLVGMTGLAPSLLIVYLICVGIPPWLDPDEVLLRTKIVELMLETIPQSMLQTYVGVSYGLFDPASSDFSLILPVSVGISLLGSGSTFFGVEMAMRKSGTSLAHRVEGEAPREDISVGSLYGAASVLLRSCQTAAVIFGTALVGCANKLPYGATWAEKVDRDTNNTRWVKIEDPAWDTVGGIYPGVITVVYIIMVLGLLGLSVYLVEGVTYENRHIGFVRRVAGNGATLACVWSATVWVEGVTKGIYRMANNYNDSSLPETWHINGTQYFDCLDRKAGTVVFDIAWMASIVLVFVCCAVDPYCGFAMFRPNRIAELEGERVRLRDDKFPTEPDSIDAQVAEICDFIRGKAGIGSEEEEKEEGAPHDINDSEIIQWTNYDVLLDLASAVSPKSIPEPEIEVDTDVECIYLDEEVATRGRVENICTWALYKSSGIPERLSQEDIWNQRAQLYGPRAISVACAVVVFGVPITMIDFSNLGGTLSSILGYWVALCIASGIWLVMFLRVDSVGRSKNAVLFMGYAVVRFDNDSEFDAEAQYMCPLAWLRIESSAHAMMKRSYNGRKALCEVPVMSEETLIRRKSDGKIGKILAEPQRKYWFDKSTRLVVDSGLASVLWDAYDPEYHPEYNPRISCAELIDPHTLEAIDEQASLEELLEMLDGDPLTDMEALVPLEVEGECDASGVLVTLGDWYHRPGTTDLIPECDLCEAEYLKLSDAEQQQFVSIEAPEDLGDDLDIYSPDSRIATEESLAALASVLRNESNEECTRQCWCATVGEKKFDTTVVLLCEIEAIWRWTDVVNDGKAASIGDDELARLAKALGLLSIPMHPGADGRYSKGAFVSKCMTDRLSTHEWFEKLKLHLVYSSEGVFYYLLLGC